MEKIKGIELAESFYNDYGRAMISECFGELENKIAVALVGSGSECLGYDDEISCDHDHYAGFCMLVPDDIDSKTEFALERAYAKLPKEYRGFKRERLDPVGGNRHGVIKIGDFFESKTGKRNGQLTEREWLLVPEQALLEATGGKVFRDDLGELTRIRKSLEYLPENVRLKKLAGNLLLMAQSGQYNYQRSISRGHTASAQLATFEFVRATLNVIFLLNKRYIPYYKWTFVALDELKILSSLHTPLEYLISSENSPSEATKKSQIMEEVSSEIIAELKRQELSGAEASELEAHAYFVNNKITSADLRNLHILAGV